MKIFRENFDLTRILKLFQSKKSWKHFWFAFFDCFPLGFHKKNCRFFSWKLVGTPANVKNQSNTHSVIISSTIHVSTSTRRSRGSLAHRRRSEMVSPNNHSSRFILQSLSNQRWSQIGHVSGPARIHQGSQQVHWQVWASLLVGRKSTCPWTWHWLLKNSWKFTFVEKIRENTMVSVWLFTTLISREKLPNSSVEKIR